NQSGHIAIGDVEDRCVRPPRPQRKHQDQTDVQSNRAHPARSAALRCSVALERYSARDASRRAPHRSSETLWHGSLALFQACCLPSFRYAVKSRSECSRENRHQGSPPSDRALPANCVSVEGTAPSVPRSRLFRPCRRRFLFAASTARTKRRPPPSRFGVALRIGGQGPQIANRRSSRSETTRTVISRS